LSLAFSASEVAFSLALSRNPISVLPRGFGLL
jgi:hypothetical protein